MSRSSILSLTLLLAMALGLLAACDDAGDPVRPSADKRDFIHSDPGDGGGGGGGGTVPPPAVPFLEQVVAAYGQLSMNFMTVSVEQSGDVVIVQAPDWPDREPFIVIIPTNTQLTGKRDIVIEYPSGAFDPANPPVIPGDVTLFTFHNLPDLDKIEFIMPPAPWFDELVLGTKSCFYNFAENTAGDLAIVGEVQYFESVEPMKSALISIDHATHSLPDNPARGLLDPEDPGDPDDPDDPETP
ncbi:hypothetical protein KDK88_03090 [bacterium]|nr:hypothetical protein [bacterium]